MNGLWLAILIPVFLASLWFCYRGWRRYRRRRAVRRRLARLAAAETGPVKEPEPEN
jgi:hypothetical protein